MAIDVRPLEAPPADDAAVRYGRPSRHRGGRLTTVAIVAVGIGTLAIVTRDGSPLWQVVRAGATVTLTALAVQGARTGGHGRRGLIACTIGVLATAVGVGIGLPHLTKTGLTGTTFAGLVVGHGRSGGRAMDFGWYGDEDVAAPGWTDRWNPTRRETP